MKAIYAFSGDPITFGHLDIIERAAKVFDKLIVAVGMNPLKKYLFSLEERAAMAKLATSHILNVKVVYFHGLLVDYAYEQNISTIVRGLRNSEDFNFEWMLHQVGESQKMNIETFFIPSKQQLSHISSSAAKALQVEQGLINEYVPLNVKQKLEERLSGQFIIGVTGEIGAGKSYLCKQIFSMAKEEGLEVHHIDVDRIGHEILEELSEPLYVKLRKEIASVFGKEVVKENGFIDTPKLAQLIFSDKNRLNEFNQILAQPLLLRLKKILYGKKGIILLDSALIAEMQMSYLCNNRLIIVSSAREDQLARLKERGYSSIQIQQKLSGQYSYQKKVEILQKELDEKRYGQLLFFENSNTQNRDKIKEIINYIRPMVIT